MEQSIIEASINKKFDNSPVYKKLKNKNSNWKKLSDFY